MRLGIYYLMFSTFPGKFSWFQLSTSTVLIFAACRYLQICLRLQCWSWRPRLPRFGRWVPGGNAFWCKVRPTDVPKSELKCYLINCNPRPCSHVYLSQLVERNGGIGKPEMRIPALCVGSLFVPVGLL